MSKVQTLRALVNERLVAAAEDISALFERTRAQYEEELCRSREENQRKQQLLEQALSSRVLLLRAGPGPALNQGLNQDFTDTSWIKEEPEEQSVTQEQEQLPEPVPESSPVCVKSEESSLFQQRQTEHRDETQGEDISSEPHFHSETEGRTEHAPDTDSDDDWEPPAAQMETEAEGDHNNQDQSRDRSIKLSLQNKSAPETTVHNDHMSGADGRAQRKKHQCSVCHKRFGTKSDLQRHTRVHTGERPYSCSTCEKAFAQKCDLVTHMRTHTGERPFKCSICEKPFADHSAIFRHMRTHTGEKPYSCSTCEKNFSLKYNLDSHMTTHTGERPFICSICRKAFTQKPHLVSHTRARHGPV